MSCSCHKNYFSSKLSHFTTRDCSVTDAPVHLGYKNDRDDPTNLCQLISHPCSTTIYRSLRRHIEISARERIYPGRVMDPQNMNDEEFGVDADPKIQ